MSDRLLSGRLPRPRMAFERRPLSNRASTASWSMRFSFRRMTSGALCWISLVSRLFRLITRRYRSFRSDVAKRPPSSGTSGRRSGGMTGITSRIIQAGSLARSPESPDERKASTILSRLSICFLRCWLVSVATPERSSSASRRMSSRPSSSRTAGAPISALNAVVALIPGLGPEGEVLVLVQQLVLFDFLLAGIDDDVARVVDDPLEVPERDVDQVPHRARVAS